MSAISEAEHGIVELAANAPMLEQVQSWAAMNSGSRNLAGLARMAEILADAFSCLPGPIELVSSDPVQTILADGRAARTDHGAHLHLNVRPDAPARILLTGHMDTVFAADDPFQTVTWLENGTLNGPGVADMKGGLSVMLGALSAFETSPLASRIGYEIIINGDEEVGSPSSAPLIMEAAKGKVAALTFEPSPPDGTLAGARSGSSNFSIIVTGKSAHAGRNPHEGHNAIVAAADLAVRLKRGSGRGFTCNPAKIDGGSPNNVVPDHAILRVNFRSRTEDDERASMALVEESMATVSREHGVSMKIHCGSRRPPKLISPEAERLYALVMQCGSSLGLSLDRQDTGGVCDGNNIAACGIPVVDTMGVRGGAIHSSDEFLIVQSLEERARLSALVLMRIAERCCI